MIREEDGEEEDEEDEEDEVVDGGEGVIGCRVVVVVDLMRGVMNEGEGGIHDEAFALSKRFTTPSLS